MYIDDFKYLSRKRRHKLVNFLMENFFNKIPLPKKIITKILYIFHKILTFAPFGIFISKSKPLLIISLIISAIVICMFVFLNGCWLSSVEKIMGNNAYNNVNDIIFKSFNIKETQQNNYYISYLIMTIGTLFASIRIFLEKNTLFITIARYSIIFIMAGLFFGISTVV